MERASHPETEAWLELDESGRDGPESLRTPHLPTLSEQRNAKQEASLEAQLVAALSDESLPLLRALWPEAPDLRSLPPSPAQLAARLEFARTAMNRLSRRNAEWRARAELASGVLARRLAELGQDLGQSVHSAATQELFQYERAQFIASLEQAAGLDRALYPRELQRLTRELETRGLAPELLQELADARGIQLHRELATAWTRLTILPGAPGSLDELRQALWEYPTQSEQCLREGLLLAWLKQNQASEALLVQTATLQATAQTATGAVLARWQLLWALGTRSLRLGNRTVESPEALLRDLRTGALQPSEVMACGELLPAWLRLFGQHGAAELAQACTHGGGALQDFQRMLWALGEPLRLAGRAVGEPRDFARQVVAREAARLEALQRLRDGGLRAWLSALPEERGAGAWSRALVGAPENSEEKVFWRGVYALVGRVPLRVPRTGAKPARISSVAELLREAQLGGAWDGLLELFAHGELQAWLEVQGVGLRTDAATSAAPVLGLHEVLWSLGFAGIVLERGRERVVLRGLSEVPSAYLRAPGSLEGALATGLLQAYFERFSRETQALEAWKAQRSKCSPAFDALGWALLAGLRVLPLEPGQGHERASFRGYIDWLPGQASPSVWEALQPHAEAGTLGLWLRRWLPDLTITDSEQEAAWRARLAALGAPKPSARLGQELRQREHSEAWRTLRREALQQVEASASVLAGLQVDSAAQRATLLAREAVLLGQLRTEQNRVRQLLAQQLRELEVLRQQCLAETALLTELRKERADVRAAREAVKVSLPDLLPAAAIELKPSRDPTPEPSQEESGNESEKNLELQVELDAFLLALRQQEALEQAREQATQGLQAALQRVESALPEPMDWSEEPLLEGESLAPAPSELPEWTDNELEALVAESDGRREELDRARLCANARVEDSVLLARMRQGYERWALQVAGEAGRSAAREQVWEQVEQQAFFAITLQLQWELRVFEQTDLLPPTERTVLAAAALGESLDPWSVELPTPSLFETRTASYALEGSSGASQCLACAGEALVACERCAGLGLRPCARCDGKGLVRCSQCAGGGERLGQRGRGSCDACEGAGRRRCGHCVAGKKRCDTCAGTSRRGCNQCGATGQRKHQTVLRQTVETQSVLSWHGPSDAEGLLELVQNTATEALPVVYLEAPELEPAKLSAELPEAGLGPKLAALLDSELAAADTHRKVLRTRIVVRRCLAWKVGAGDEALWFVGGPERVWCARNPFEKVRSREAQSLAEALAGGAWPEALRAYLALQSKGSDQNDAMTEWGQRLAKVLAAPTEAQGGWEAGSWQQARALEQPEVRRRVVELERERARAEGRASVWLLSLELSRAEQQGHGGLVLEKLHALAKASPSALLAVQSWRKLLQEAEGHASAGEYARARRLVSLVSELPIEAVRKAGESARNHIELQAIRRLGTPLRVGAVGLALGLAGVCFAPGTRGGLWLFVAGGLGLALGGVGGVRQLAEQAENQQDAKERLGRLGLMLLAWMVVVFLVGRATGA